MNHRLLGVYKRVNTLKTEPDSDIIRLNGYSNEHLINILNGGRNQVAENEISPSCEYMHIHSDLVDKVNENMPDDDILCDLAELYRVFGDSTRIRILYALFESEMCVCDIAQVLGMSISAISHQLRVLKQARLVKYRREGKTVFYSLSDDHVRSIIDQGIGHVEE